MPVSLSISLVLYQPNIQLLQQTLDGLNQAISLSKQNQQLSECFLTVIDNGSDKVASDEIKSAIQKCWLEPFQFQQSRYNLGYGLGHNQAIKLRCEAYHLVINPDIKLDEYAIVNAIAYMNDNPDVGMITPSSYQSDGSKAYLCKSYPSVFVLLLRGFAPKYIKGLFSRQLAEYELRLLPEKTTTEIELASGCFMFFRGKALLSINGFSEQFFLYFEDFDLSIRLKQHWKIAYVPEVKVIHYGGQAAKKGLKHIKYFICSAWQFFNRHGWKIV